MLSLGLQSISSQNTAPFQPPLIMYCRSIHLAKKKKGLNTPIFKEDQKSLWRHDFLDFGAAVSSLFGDEGPGVEGGCGLEDGPLEQVTWQRRHQVEPHAGRPSWFYTENRSRDSGDTRWNPTLADPADSAHKIGHVTAATSGGTPC